MILKKLGYYKELSYGDASDPSIMDHIHHKIENKKELCNYLRSGHILAACGGVVHDVINPDKGIIGSPDTFTDGTWIWQADLSYYVEEYDLDLGNDFIDHIKSLEWHVPQDIDIDYDNIEVI
ncbi:MAG: hypothetical protein J5715_01220 [Clostridiales bacterium]|nr:hypothetical protein [Clostridiales bacterium]